MHIVNFFDPRLGYAEFYLAKKQIEYGHEVCIVSFDQPISENRKWSSGLNHFEGIDVFYLRSFCKFRGGMLIFNPFVLRRIIKDFSPDVVHCHGLLSPLCQEAVLLRNSYSYKVVGDLITGISPIASKLLQHFKAFFSFSLLNRVDELFANNFVITNLLIDVLGVSSRKVHLIPLGADIKLFRPDSEQRTQSRALLGLIPEDVVVIYTGKFLPSKRLHELLIASKSIIDQYHNFKLVFVGNGPLSYKTKLDLMIKKLGLNKNVIMLKTVHRTKLPTFYNAADIAVWPGTFSISIIEAMACGLPIIIAKSDWTSHYLEYNNGYSFKAGDIPSLNSILLNLVVNSELRKSMGAGSRKLVEDKLNWDVITREYIDVYQKIVAK